MSELRIDAASGRRVYIAEDRAGRPSDYAAAPQRTSAPKIDYRADCPFCAGNEAETPLATATTFDGEGRWLVRVVPNKFPAVSLDAPIAEDTPDGRILNPFAGWGLHEVVIESPRHGDDVADLDVNYFAAVLAMFRDRLRYCTKRKLLKHATVFKNFGFTAGASLEHPHSQIVAMPFVPPAIEAELAAATAVQEKTGRCAYCNIVEFERRRDERIVIDQSGYIAACAYAGRQPFESLVLPERHASRFEELADDELPPLADVLQKLLRQLARVSDRRGIPLAYNLILHTAPFGESHAESYHWHWELIPRFTHLAGLEWGAGVYINPVSPERAARELRDVAD